MATARSWLSRLFRREPDVRRVLEAYGACLERQTTGTYRRDHDLPYSKEQIGRAILTALKFSDRREVREPLRRGFVELESFLPEHEWTRADADAQLRQDIEDRRERRRQLLEILDRERTTSR